MSCRDIHATTAFAFVVALLSVGALVTAALVPQWRVTHLVTFNRNAKNVTVYDGLWVKCVRQQGSSSCYFYDTEWYARVDQLDLRVLQFALPFSVFFATLALLLNTSGMCKTACCSAEPDSAASKCLVNSAGCHLVSGFLLFIAGGVAMAPSVWFLFYTKELNRKYDNLFSDDFAVYVAIGGSGGLFLASLLFLMWYCMCKTLPSPFWLPLPGMPKSISSQPLAPNGYPSPVYAPQVYAPQVYAPQVYAPQAIEHQAYAPPQVYVPQLSAPDGYGSEVNGSQACGVHGYAPSLAYGSSYAGPRYSTRSRMSTIEIDIPVLSQES